MKTRAITLMKEDVLSLGRLVNITLLELARILKKDPTANLELIEQQEGEINKACLKIEEKCLSLLTERQDLTAQEIRTLVGSTLIAAKFERLADHALRIAKLVSWVATETVEIPPQLAEMAVIVNHIVEDVLLVYLTDAVEKVPEILQRDSNVDYLHDFLSKKLLSDLGKQSLPEAQKSTQLLFCTRYLERMGDYSTSIAKRIHFIVTGTHISQSGD